ncbi:E3 ubiquitin-protein ligase TRIM56-like [Amphiura filiformis]|uniref:E3 ubiquitin-protein ligase TRIM56-like n=1 Tax=Amphiura filiformis TaxID=82378 RepID=UPI003B22703C
MAAEMSRKQVKQFADDDLIQCGICHIDIEHPRSLLCLHTFCLRCLREWSKNNKKEVICPVCREPTPLPANGVDGLRSNFLVTKLKDRKALSRQLMDKDVKIVCTSCDVSDGNEAVARCLECDDFLCSKCSKTHKTLRSIRSHSVLSLVELRSGKVSLVKINKEEHCMEHTGQVLWFYCKTCDVPICRDCTVVEHPTGSHELVKLDIAMTGQREEIQGLVAKCQVVKQELDEAFQKVQQIQGDLEATYSKVRTSIDARRDEVMKALTMIVDKQTDELKKSAAGMKSAREKFVTAHQDELQLLNSRLNTALEMGIKLTTDGSDCDVAAAYKQLTDALKQLEKAGIPYVDLGDIVFVEGSSPTTFALQIGKIEETKVATTQRWSIRKRNKEMWNAPWKMVKKIGEGMMKDARGVAINQDGDVAVADHESKRVYVYGIDDGNMMMDIDTTKSLHSNPGLGSFPRGLTVYNGDYIVADDTLYPTIYDSRGNYVRQIPNETFEKDKCVDGICADGRGSILVERSSQLSIHNYDDSKLKSTLDVPFDPKYMAVSSDDDKIIISANNSPGARVIDSNGQIIHTPRPPTDVTSYWYPSGVCTIGEGDDEEIFIGNCDKTQGIYRFSLTTGKYLGCVTTDVSVPQGIAFTEDEKLVVADKTCIKVFAPADM